MDFGFTQEQEELPKEFISDIQLIERPGSFLKGVTYLAISDCSAQTHT